MYVFRISSHIYNSSISLQLVSPFASSPRLSPPAFLQYTSIRYSPRRIRFPFTSVCFHPVFPYFRSSHRSRNELSNSMHETALNVDEDRENLIVYHIRWFIVKCMLLMTFMCSIFHLVSCRSRIKQVSRLNMLLNKFSYVAFHKIARASSPSFKIIFLFF